MPLLKSFVFLGAGVLVLMETGSLAVDPQTAAQAQPPLTLAAREPVPATGASEASGDKSVQPTTPAEAPSAATPDQSIDFRRVPQIKGIVIVRSLKEFNPDGVPLKPGLTRATPYSASRPWPIRKTDPASP